MTSLHTGIHRRDEDARLTRQLFSTLEALADDKRAASGSEEPKAIIERIIVLDALLQKQVDQSKQESHQCAVSRPDHSSCTDAAVMSMLSS